MATGPRGSQRRAPGDEIGQGPEESHGRDAKTADEITTVTPNNRMIGFPYPKFMNAIIDVDQSAAVLMTRVNGTRQRRPQQRLRLCHADGQSGHHGRDRPQSRHRPSTRELRMVTMSCSLRPYVCRERDGSSGCTLIFNQGPSTTSSSWSTGSSAATRRRAGSSTTTRSSTAG